MMKDFEALKIKIDANMVKIRQDFDIGALKRSIALKMPSKNFDGFKNETEERLSVLDNSFLLVG